MCAVAIAAKGPTRVMAITDATSGAGLPVGATSALGGQTIHVRDQAAFLDDGTLAGSTLTMDRAFQNIVTMFGRSLHDAVLDVFNDTSRPARTHRTGSDLRGSPGRPGHARPRFPSRADVCCRQAGLARLRRGFRPATSAGKPR